MPKCKCGAQNVEGETRCVLCSAWLPQGVDKGTRSGGVMRTTYSMRQGLRNYEKGAIRLPLKDVEDKAIWDGCRSKLGGFSDEFTDDFLAKYYASAQAKGITSKVVGGVTLYQCPSCKKHVSRKKDAPESANWISIDHRVSIREYVASKTCAKNSYLLDHLWEYYLLEECKAAHLDHSNLQPMCQSCNSSKSGTKNLDGEMRTHLKDHCRQCSKKPTPYDRP